MKLDWKDIALIAIVATLVGVLVLRNHGDYVDKALMLLMGPAGVIMLLKGRTDANPPAPPAA